MPSSYSDIAVSIEILGALALAANTRMLAQALNI